MKCKKCGRILRPAPAKFDGESTYVGYLPCPCQGRKCPHCGSENVIAWGPDADKCTNCELTWDA